MESYLFEKEIRLFGMKRSGNSAVIAFLWGHFGRDEAVHLHHTNLTFYGLRMVRSGKIGKIATLAEKMSEVGEKVRYLTNRVEHMPIGDIGVCLKPWYCYDIERVVFAIKCEKSEFARDVYNIVLLRSPHNHMASVIKGKVGSGVLRGSYWYTEFADLWIQYAREALSITEHIPNKVVILFDKLVTSVDYRKSISDVLGLAHSDFGISYIAGHTGSSFDGKKYKHNAQEMKVLDRWRYIIDPGEKTWWTLDECKEKLLRPEVVEYTKELFDIDLKEIF